MAQTPTRFAAKIRAERGYSRYLLRGLDYTGRDAWYSVDIAPVTEQAFLSAWQRGLAVDITTWGTVVASGYGAPPGDLIPC